MFANLFSPQKCHWGWNALWILAFSLVLFLDGKHLPWFTLAMLALSIADHVYYLIRKTIWSKLANWWLAKSCPWPCCGWRGTDLEEHTIDFHYSLRKKHCSVCGVISRMHPGTVDTSPPYSIPCPGGEFIV